MMTARLGDRLLPKMALSKLPKKCSTADTEASAAVLTLKLVPRPVGSECC